MSVMSKGRVEQSGDRHIAKRLVHVVRKDGLLEGDLRSHDRDILTVS